MSLKDYISQATTSLGQSFESWQQALTYAGGLLEQTGCIAHSYTEGMVEMVEELGPYIVVMPGVALAHARPKGNVQKNSIALVTSSEGIKFGNTSNDPVYTIFAIAAKTDQEHLVLFSDLAKFIGREENMTALRSAKTFEEILF